MGCTTATGRASRIWSNFGFRLPSALDNRPLTFEEFEERVHQAVFVSATPGRYELEHSEGEIVEQVIRPTGLLDPVVEVRPAQHQVDDLLAEIRTVVARGERVLVTTLTKRMSEDLTTYLAEVGLRVRYLHSEIDTLERIAILADLRRGEFDVLVGINLLREGLDLPEVSLVAVLDADQEGFLRSETSLIQTVGRAARNLNGRAILYADKETGSMQRALAETRRRRTNQAEFNAEHGIEPRSIIKDVASPLLAMSNLDYYGPGGAESAGVGTRRGRVRGRRLVGQAHHRARKTDAHRGQDPRVRGGRQAARSHQGAAAAADLQELTDSSDESRRRVGRAEPSQGIAVRLQIKKWWMGELDASEAFHDAWVERCGCLPRQVEAAPRRRQVTHESARPTRRRNSSDELPCQRPPEM